MCAHDSIMTAETNILKFLEKEKEKNTTWFLKSFLV